MTSATGSSLARRVLGDRRGFTFFEVMVTVAVLASGLVLVYQSLLTCVDAHVSYSNRLAVSSWMSEKMWETHEQLYQPAEGMKPETEGELLLRNRNISWRMSVTDAGQPDLYKLDLTCSWKEGRRAVNLAREGYVLCIVEEVEEVDSR